MATDKTSPSRARKPARPSKAAVADKPAPAEAAAPGASQPVERAFRKTRVGTVVSTRMAKTIVVRVERMVKHRLYPRTIRRASKLMAHDPDGRAKMGDTVRVMETRPISRTKRWRLVEVVREGSPLAAQASEAQRPGQAEGA